MIPVRLVAVLFALAVLGYVGLARPERAEREHATAGGAGGDRPPGKFEVSDAETMPKAL